MSSASSSNSSSSSSELRRSITLKRSEIAEYVEGRTQAYRVRFDVTEAVCMSAEVFVYQRRPGTLPGAEAIDEFSNVASPADLEEYPVGEPEGTSPFFRLHYVDLVFRSLELLEQSADDLVGDVCQLVETLDQLSTLTEHFITFTGDACPDDPTSPVIKVTVTTRDPTVDDDITQNYATGSIWVNATTGAMFILADNTEGAADWVQVTGGGVLGAGLGLYAASGNMNVFVDNNTTDISALNKVIAATPTKLDQDLVPDTTSGDDSDSGLTLSTRPAGRGSGATGDRYVTVFVNGVKQRVGDGVKTQACFFSESVAAPFTAKYLADLTLGDKLIWNGTIAGYELDSDDIVDLAYLSVG